MSKYLDAIELHKHIKERIAEVTKSALYIKDKTLYNEIKPPIISSNLTTNN